MIGLVSCSAQKGMGLQPARTLYTSALFRKSLAYAEQECDFVYIVSALHGLLELDREVVPYDCTIASMTPTQRKLWGGSVARELFKRHSTYLETESVMLLAGESYVRPITTEYTRGFSHLAIVEPLRGMQIGERLSWLNAKTRKAA